MTSRGTRSQRRQAEGLGSAGTGVSHWWMQRATAVALVPLTLWFTSSLFATVRGGYGAVIAWLESPLAAVLMVLLFVALFQHAALGLQVVIEDYVHSTRARVAAVLAVKLGCYALAVAGVIAALRIAVGG